MAFHRRCVSIPHMPERLGANNKEKINQAHDKFSLRFTNALFLFQRTRLIACAKSLSAYIGKTNPERIDVATMTDAIAEKITANPQARERWFKKAGLLHTLEEHARQNTQRAAELRRSLAERTEWTPVPAEASTTDGRYYLAQLVSAGHLKQESAFLEHCLGTGSLDYYLPRIRRSDIEIFSVRDSETHEPVVTIEYDIAPNPFGK